MPILHPVVFPLFSITPEGKCGCGNAACNRVGKHPRIKWKDIEFGSPVPRPEPGAGYGVKTGAAPKGSGVFVVDCDGVEAVEAFAALGECPDTYTVLTPRGAHFYFQAPDFYVSNSASSLAKGTDVRGDGGFVVGAGSPHRSGGTYDLISDLEPAPAPVWLIDWLRAHSRAPVEVQVYPGDVEGKERERRQALFLEHCRKAAPAVEGERDKKLWPLCQHASIDLALPSGDTLNIIREAWNPRCSPPLDEEELRRVVLHKCDDAKVKSQRPAAEPWPECFTLLSAPLPENLPVKKKRGGIVWGGWDKPVEPPAWLVQGLIPVGTVGGLVAHGSSLKTWVTLSMSIAVAQGSQWLGKYGTRKSKALLVDYESGLHELRRRVRLLEGSSIEDLGAWAYPNERIDTLDFWKALAEIDDIGLVCIDSLAEGTTPGVDENSKEAALPLQFAARWSEVTDGSVLFVHHSKKDDAGDARKSVRGSTAIYAAMDWCYGFEQIEENDQYHRARIVCTKPCMGSKPPAFSVELTDAGLHSYVSRAPEKPKAQWTSEEIATRIRDTLAAKVMAKDWVKNIDKLVNAAGVDMPRGRLEVKDMLAKNEIQLMSHSFVLNGHYQKPE